MRFRPAQGAVRVFPPQKGRPAGRRRDQQGVTAPEAIPDLTIVFSLAFAIFLIMRIYANLCQFMLRPFRNRGSVLPINALSIASYSEGWLLFASFCPAIPPGACIKPFTTLYRPITTLVSL